MLRSTKKLLNPYSKASNLKMILKLQMKKPKLSLINQNQVNSNYICFPVSDKILSLIPIDFVLNHECR